VGATGVRQVCDIVRQLRGKVDGNIRIPSATTGLALNIGGTGATAVVTILSSQEEGE
jgi:acetyl-CoA C-acetyltransferase